MKAFALGSIILIGATLSFSALAADDENYWMKTDRFSLAFGIFFVEEDTEITLSGDLGPGTPIDFQDDLGFDADEEVVRFAGHYRFKPRHRINFGYWDLSRDSDAVLLNDIIFDDTFFPAGTTVESELGFTNISILYTYSFYQTPKLDLGVSTGFQIYEFDSTIEAPAIAVEEEGDGTAPFPVVGLRVRQVFSPKWSWGLSYDYFDVESGDTEGQVIDIVISVDHRTWKNVGLGIGYNDVSIDAEDQEGGDEIDWDYDGFFGYVRAYF
ncbi:MAG: hypothetical protein ACE5FE_01750 [Acidiferrobacterales bacterium]